MMVDANVTSRFDLYLPYAAPAQGSLPIAAGKPVSAVIIMPAIIGPDY
jgi:hypothetical protein